MTCSFALPQARFSGTDDGLGSVGNLQLGEDVGDVVAYRLGAQRQLPGDRRIGVSLRDEVQDLTRELLRDGYLSVKECAVEPSQVLLLLDSRFNRSGGDSSEQSSPSGKVSSGGGGRQDAQ